MPFPYNVNKTVYDKLIAYFPFIRHGRHRKQTFEGHRFKEHQCDVIGLPLFSQNKESKIIKWYIELPLCCLYFCRLICLTLASSCFPFFNFRNTQFSVLTAEALRALFSQTDALNAAIALRTFCTIRSQLPVASLQTDFLCFWYSFLLEAE
jgi:hypothetical protein